jgi:hypothetical protein
MLDYISFCYEYDYIFYADAADIAYQEYLENSISEDDYLDENDDNGE